MAVTIDEVIQLSKAGASAQLIVRVIEKEKTVFKLDAAQIEKLRNAGVVDRVILFMLKTPEHFAARVVPPKSTVLKPAPAVTEKQRVRRSPDTPKKQKKTGSETGFNSRSIAITQNQSSKPAKVL